MNRKEQLIKKLWKLKRAHKIAGPTLAKDIDISASSLYSLMHDDYYGPPSETTLEAVEKFLKRTKLKY